MDKMPHTYFREVNTLTNHGNNYLRQCALDIIDHGLIAADPGNKAHSSIRLNGSILSVFDKEFDLNKYERIFIFGAGKATLPIVQVLEEILDNRITDGVVILKKGSQSCLNHVQVFYGGHPIPDEDGFLGARRMFNLAGNCRQNDLVIAVFTGGSSALVPLPVEEVSLAEKKEVTKLLLNCGADITQINTVRKHLSQIKGGWLAKRIFPATIINLTVSDVIGDQLDYITDPTVPDTSTFYDARKVIDDYNLWEQLPVSVAKYLHEGKSELETPKDFRGAPVFSYILTNGTDACLGAFNRAKELGFNSMILTTTLQGEAKEAGIFLSSIAKEVLNFDRPILKPCALILGGENTVTINNHCSGQGGPNQELALSAAIKISGLNQVLIMSIDTDGTDGPTEICGGIVDGSTGLRAANLGLNLTENIHQHNVSSALRLLGDAVVTGQTGTNVNDLKLILVQ